MTARIDQMRPREVRAHTLNIYRLGKRELEQAATEVRDCNFSRPRTRGECEHGQRPCPYVGCKFNLYLEVSRNGSIKFNFPDLEPDEMTVSCVLDVAERGGITASGAGPLLNLTRERVRQIEVAAIDKLMAVAFGCADDDE